MKESFSFSTKQCRPRASSIKEAPVSFVLCLLFIISFVVNLVQQNKATNGQTIKSFISNPLSFKIKPKPNACEPHKLVDTFSVVNFIDLYITLSQMYSLTAIEMYIGSLNYLKLVVLAIILKVVMEALFVGKARDSMLCISGEEKSLSSWMVISTTFDFLTLHSNSKFAVIPLWLSLIGGLAVTLLIIKLIPSITIVVVDIWIGFILASVYNSYLKVKQDELDAQIESDVQKAEASLTHGEAASLTHGEAASLTHGEAATLLT